MTAKNSSGWLVCDECGQLVTTRQPCEKHPPKTLAQIGSDMEDIVSGTYRHISQCLENGYGSVIVDGAFSIDELITLGDLAKQAKAVFEQQPAKCKS